MFFAAPWLALEESFARSATPVLCGSWMSGSWWVSSATSMELKIMKTKRKLLVQWGFSSVADILDAMQKHFALVGEPMTRPYVKCLVQPQM
eukprot:4086641-Amphidinium_carterae.1